MSGRTCFPCTACCEGWLTADINGHKMKPGTPCVHKTAQGCGIYSERPEDPCVKFKCGWLLQQELFPDTMKPSECGAIVVFWEMYGRQVISAVPTGKEVPSDTLDWLKSFAREKSIPLVFSERIVSDDKFIGVRRLGYGPPSFIEAVKTKIGPDDIMMF